MQLRVVLTLDQMDRCILWASSPPPGGMQAALSLTSDPPARLLFFFKQKASSGCGVGGGQGQQAGKAFFQPGQVMGVPTILLFTKAGCLLTAVPWGGGGRVWVPVRWVKGQGVMWTPPTSLTLQEGGREQASF